MPGHVSLDFMAVSSYAKGTTSRPARCGCSRTSTRRSTAATSIIVEDIVDTGLTLTTCRTSCAPATRKSLRTACLLSKPSRRKVDVTVEYIGFTIEDRFVVGYGLDYAEQYRNLPHIAVLEPEHTVSDRDRALRLSPRDRSRTRAASRFASAITAARSSVRT